MFGNDDLEEGLLLSRRTEIFEGDSFVKNKEACDDDFSEDTSTDIGVKDLHSSGMIREMPVKTLQPELRLICHFYTQTA